MTEGNMRKSDGKNVIASPLADPQLPPQKWKHNDACGTCLSVEQGKIQVIETRIR